MIQYCICSIRDDVEFVNAAFLCNAVAVATHAKLAISLSATAPPERLVYASPHVSAFSLDAAGSIKEHKNECAQAVWGSPALKLFIRPSCFIS